MDSHCDTGRYTQFPIIVFHFSQDVNNSLGYIDMVVHLRPVSDAERAELDYITTYVPCNEWDVERPDVVVRARVLAFASEGWKPSLIAARVGVTERTVREWIGRFNVLGDAHDDLSPRDAVAQAHALYDLLQGVRRPGRSRTPVYGPDVVRRIGEIALTHPADLALPYAHWTLERLQRYLNECESIAIRHSRLADILHASRISFRPRPTDQYLYFGDRSGDVRPWMVTPSTPLGRRVSGGRGRRELPAPDA